MELYYNEKLKKCEFCHELIKLGACDLVFCKYMCGDGNQLKNKESERN